ncbi:MAG TPA: hypothetical protein VFL81_01005 [Candidatus Saccharimonadales bacterium]|nr:hypothetical protein [Candidatus Saccharimonadales bacterium]
MFRLIKDLGLILPVLALLALLAIFSLTNPIGIGPVGVLIVFILFYVFFASSFFLLLYYGGGLVAKVSQRRLKAKGMASHKAYYVSSVLAFGPVLLIALQSVGQLKIQDVALVVILLVIAVFYVVRRS